jgi:hypothetical protein
LAERDGLVAMCRNGRFYNSGCIVRAGQDEVPWRFAHPEVAVLWRFAQRLSAFARREPPAKDTEGRAIDRCLAGEPAARRDPLDLFDRALAAVENSPRSLSMSGLLDCLRRGGEER